MCCGFGFTEVRSNKMEKIRTLRMLISRYRADAADLARREEDLTRELEIIENLISTATIWYISKVIQTREMQAPQQETEKAREKLDRLKRILGDIRQSIEVVKDEETVIRKRIEELETLLNYQPDSYTSMFTNERIFEKSNLADNIYDSTIQKEIYSIEAEHLEKGTEENQLQTKDSGRKCSEELISKGGIPKTIIEHTEQSGGSYNKGHNSMKTERSVDLHSSDAKLTPIITDKSKSKYLTSDLADYTKTKCEKSFDVGFESSVAEESVTFDQGRNISHKFDENNGSVTDNDKMIKTSNEQKCEDDPLKSAAIDRSNDEAGRDFKFMQFDENNGSVTDNDNDKTIKTSNEQKCEDNPLESAAIDRSNDEAERDFKFMQFDENNGSVTDNDKTIKTSNECEDNPLESAAIDRSNDEAERDFKFMQFDENNGSVTDNDKTIKTSNEQKCEDNPLESAAIDRSNDETERDFKFMQENQDTLVNDTNWNHVYGKLVTQVNELREDLEHSSLKLRQSAEYVKNLEEECLKLEKEIKDKIHLLENKFAALDQKEKGINCEDINALLPTIGVKNSLLAMQEAIEKSINALKEASTSMFSNMVEGEGVTPAYMQMAHWRFTLKLPEYQGDKELKEKLMTGIKQGNMAPYYKEVCADLGWEFDTKLYDEMSVANTKRLEELEKEHENNVMDEEDQSQLCGVWQSKLDYLCSIGDRENATTLANSKVDDKTVPKSHRIDAVFSLFRISFFHGCNIKGMSTAIEKATELIEGISGGDWSARNKLKAYEGVWSLAIRDFTRAAHLFVDVVPTFESYELADFGTIIRYTVLSCMIALPRCDLRKKLMLHGVMAQALHSQYQDLREYFVSLYDGRYSDFLVCLARIEVEMKRDPLLHPHYRHYVQEMRLRAYKQILQAYRSLSLDYMAQSFGVTSEFIEREVARFAAAGRLQCKIDSVAGTVITSAHLDDSVRSKEAPEASLDRNILYQTTVKRGDILLNRLKKLARVMDF